MIEARSFAGADVGVLGLARSGLSAVRALAAGGACVHAWDDREAPRAAAEKAGAAILPWADWPWTRIRHMVLSPGIPLTHPAPHAAVLRAREAGAEIIGDLEIFARNVADPAAGGQPGIVAVTGTNGKSTTTALIGHVLAACGHDARVGGNIGKPALDLGPPGPHTVYVLEVSSYQIELSPGLAPGVAVLTNLSPDHIDRHGSMARYAGIKESLLVRARSDGHVVIGVDDTHSAAIHTRLSASRGPETVPVSVGKVLGRGIFVLDGVLYDAWGQRAERVLDLADVPRLPGAHNWQNAGLAYAAVRRLVRDPAAIAGAVRSFPGLAHRIELVGQAGKVRFVNDSKATNADAAARALACYDDIFWIAGGRPKEGGIAALEAWFPRIRKAYLIGEAAGDFAAALAGKVACVEAGTLDRAVAAAFEDAGASAAPAPVVLLSPACASFDQFRDFEDRGDAFRTLAQACISTPRRAEASS